MEEVRFHQLPVEPASNKKQTKAGTQGKEERQQSM
jgi:hypothetical protein